MTSKVSKEIRIQDRGQFRVRGSGWAYGCGGSGSGAQREQQGCLGRLKQWKLVEPKSHRKALASGGQGTSDFILWAGISSCAVLTVH